MEEKDIKIENKDEQKHEKQHIKTVSGMFRNWFVDYASYVILERAVPHINDGLKPVHRRILQAMKRLDDGRFNKVANIIGYTMQYHPHGDASIGDAIVQLGQKDLLIETQGNWGNIYTGDNAAAPRYIEARLSKFALEVAFNPKTTKWKLSYDGRNKEPIHLPMKFPLLLAQGVEGIAVGLASKILPHNFIELIDASIKHLNNQPFEIYPDFPTGGTIDISKYNDGIRGGKIRVRAKIEKIDKRTLCVTEIPYGKTTTSLIESVVSAVDKAKIKIKKIEDKTAAKVKILVHLNSDVSPDQTIDALYAFTDCEVAISPNACIIEDDKPRFIGVSEILRMATERTRELLREELQIRNAELDDAWHLSSLEKIFIENRIYITIEECVTWQEIIDTIDKGLTPFKHKLRREVTTEDIERLTEIKIKRISKYDAFKADEQIKAIEEEMKQINYDLAHIVEYAIAYFKHIKEKYSEGRERMTEIKSFDNIVATDVVLANEKLYVNWTEGFAGISLKKDTYMCECSDIDDMIIFRRDGTYVITKVVDKFFIGQNAIYVNVFRKNDERTIYNVVYRDGATTVSYAKRFFVSGITRDKEYRMTTDHKSSEVLYFSANFNGEAEILTIKLRPRERLKIRTFDFDFSEILIKNRNSLGNVLTKYLTAKISLKEKGDSTLGGKKLWIDMDILKLNIDGRGKFLGEFKIDEKLIVIRSNGQFRTANVEIPFNFNEDTIIVEKFDPQKVYNVIYYDGALKYFYLKRLIFEDSENEQFYITEDKGSLFVAISNVENPLVEIIYGGKYEYKTPDVFVADDFIKVKSFRARGKRLSLYEMKSMRFIETQDADANIKITKTFNNQENADENNTDITEPEFEIIRPKKE